MKGEWRFEWSVVGRVGGGHGKRGGKRRFKSGRTCCKCRFLVSASSSIVCSLLFMCLTSSSPAPTLLTRSTTRFNPSLSGVEGSEAAPREAPSIQENIRYQDILGWTIDHIFLAPDNCDVTHLCCCWRRIVRWWRFCWGDRHTWKLCSTPSATPGGKSIN